MRNIGLIIEFDGSNYSGWQAQVENVRTISNELKRALNKIIHEDNIKFKSASRTDAGVHALFFPLNFYTNSDINEEKLKKGLNSLLPPEIAVKEVKELPIDFDVRKHSIAKVYNYKIIHNTQKSPFMNKRALILYRKLDIDSMKNAILYFKGSHDFTSFRSSKCDSKTPIREVYYINLTDIGNEINITICANAFLKNMVRIIVGTLISIGDGKFSPEYIPYLFQVRDRRKAGMTAPPWGLYLMRVFFDPEELFSFVGNYVPIYKAPYSSIKSLNFGRGG